MLIPEKTITVLPYYRLGNCAGGWIGGGSNCRCNCCIKCSEENKFNAYYPTVSFGYAVN